MFWIADIYFKNKINVKRSKKFKRKIIKYDDSCLWLVFLPWKTSIELSEKFNLIPKQWTVIIYEWPDNLVSYVPQEMPEAQKILADDLSKYLKENKDNIPSKKYILWISQWIYPSFYISNKVVKCDKLIACTPAGKWEEALWESIALKWLVNESKANWYSFDDYKRLLKEWNPDNNIINLPEDIEIHYWLFDKYIMNKLTIKLISDIEKIWRKPKIFKYRFTGHYLTIFLFWRYIRKNYSNNWI